MTANPNKVAQASTISIEDLLKHSPRRRQAFEHRSDVLEAAALIRDMRKHGGLSQEELAERIGTQQSHISELERGNGSQGPTFAMLKRIARACGEHFELAPKSILDSLRAELDTLRGENATLKDQNNVLRSRNAELECRNGRLAMDSQALQDLARELTNKAYLMGRPQPIRGVKDTIIVGADARWGLDRNESIYNYAANMLSGAVVISVESPTDLYQQARAENFTHGLFVAFTK